MIKFAAEKIDPAEVLQSVGSHSAGANVIFLGTTRQFTSGEETVKLEYNGYESMVIKELESIRTTAMSRWPIEKCTIVHRHGTVELGEASVAVAVSTAHRADSFAAAEWILETLKQKAPIWKQDFGPGGKTKWVKGHPVQVKDDDPT
jgi:molybdopterin synthase catalytic subunit